MARDDQNRIALGIETNTRQTYQRAPNKRENKITEAVIYNENIDEDFPIAPLWGMSNNSDGVPVAVGSEPVAGDELTFSSGRDLFEYHVGVVESTGTAIWNLPIQAATGLDINGDADATDAITACEITNGITALSKAAYTVGSFPDVDKKIYFSCKFAIADISDVTEIAVGLRKAEAYQVAVDNYDEAAFFSIGQDADGQLEIHTILNGGATSETDTTETDWADAGEHTLEIEVSNNGSCQFFFDNAKPTVTTAFTFDSAEVLVPFFHQTQETGDPGITISEWKMGVK